MTLITDLFGELPARKTWLDQCLKSCVSQDASTDNMGNGSKHCSSLNETTFIIFINYCEGSALEKVSLSDKKNPKTVW